MRDPGSAKRKWLAAVPILLGVLTSAVGCSRPDQSPEREGQFTLALTLPSFASISAMTYTVHAGAPAGIPDAAGTLPTEAEVQPSAFIAFPVSAGDHVVLDGTTSGGASCHGVSEVFDVAPNASTTVQIQVVCGASAVAPPVPGPVIIRGEVVEANPCPVLTDWSVSPLETSFGGVIDLAVAAEDANDPQAQLTYSWSRTDVAGPSDGWFSNPAGPSSRFNCFLGFDPQGPSPATYSPTIVVSVTDHHAPVSCTTTATFVATCVTAR